ncbi:MAG: 3D domain-containing protein, partial [Planctomycetota bacterium]|nr:3D domain-containing protein [Planctomycetota bacterium]
ECPPWQDGDSLGAWKGTRKKMEANKAAAVTPWLLKRSSNSAVPLAWGALCVALAGAAAGWTLTHRGPAPMLVAVSLAGHRSADSPINAVLRSDTVVSVAKNDPVRPPDAANGAAQPQRSTSVDATRWFDGRPIRPVRTMAMLVTAYSPDERSCGQFADGITASGYSVWTNAMKLAAADTSVLPFGTLVSVPGYHDSRAVPVLDRGGAIKGDRLDILFPTHEAALQWGVQHLDVTIWEYADGQPDDFTRRFKPGG